MSPVYVNGWIEKTDDRSGYLVSVTVKMVFHTLGQSGTAGCSSRARANDSAECFRAVKREGCISYSIHQQTSTLDMTAKLKSSLKTLRFTVCTQLTTHNCNRQHYGDSHFVLAIIFQSSGICYLAPNHVKSTKTCTTTCFSSSRETQGIKMAADIVFVSVCRAGLCRELCLRMLILGSRVWSVSLKML